MTPRRKPRPEKQGVELDPRETQQVLWQWLLANSWQQPAQRSKQSRRAKQRDDEYWENHSRAVAEDHRKKREAWLTDKERLLTETQPDS